MKFLIVLLLLSIYFPLFPATNETFTLSPNQNMGALYSPSTIKIGPDGNIYAFDSKDQALKIYSGETGKFIRKISGRAEGPGYYLDFSEFGFHDNKTLFFIETHNGHSWITYLDLSGKLIKTVKTERKSRYGFSDAKILPDKRIIAEYYTYSPEPPKKNGVLWVENYWQNLVIINQEGKFVKSLMEITQPLRLSETPSSTSIIAPFFSDYIWDITRDNRIIFTQGNSNILQLFDFQGKHVGQIKTPLPESPKVTSNDLKDWRDERKRYYAEKNKTSFYNQFIAPILDHYPNSLYDRKQIIDKISVTPSNNVLIRELKPKNSRLYKHYLINLKGDALANITSGAYDILISDKIIIYVIDDEEENPTVFCVKRKGSEKEDILRLNGK